MLTLAESSVNGGRLTWVFPDVIHQLTYFHFVVYIVIGASDAV